MNKLIPADAVLIPSNAKRVFEGVIYDVYQWPQPLYDGSSATFEMLKRPDTVEVIGIVEDKILVINDEQPHRGLRVSFPGGRVDKGEDVLQAAKREVKEETGHVFKKWRLVKVWQPHTKIEWFINLFIAWDVREIVKPHLDGGEKISTKLLDFAAVKELVDSKVGHLGEASILFETTRSTSGLLALPEYTGKPVDR